MNRDVGLRWKRKEAKRNPASRDKLAVCAYRDRDTSPWDKPLSRILWVIREPRAFTSTELIEDGKLVVRDLS